MIKWIRTSTLSKKDSLSSFCRARRCSGTSQPPPCVGAPSAHTQLIQMVPQSERARERGEREATGEEPFEQMVPRTRTSFRRGRRCSGTSLPPPYAGAPSVQVARDQNFALTMARAKARIGLFVPSSLDAEGADVAVRRCHRPMSVPHLQGESLNRSLNSLFQVALHLPS